MKTTINAHTKGGFALPKMSVAVITPSGVGVSGRIWWTGVGEQSVLAKVINTTDQIVVGPYVNDANLEVECVEGVITYERLETSLVPVTLAEQLGLGNQVPTSDATPNTIPVRTDGGQLIAADAEEGVQLVTLGQLNSRFSDAQRQAVDALTEESSVADVIAALKAT